MLCKTRPYCVAPQDYNLSAQTVRLQTADQVTLEGWLIKAAKGSTKTIVLVHGFGMNKGEVLKRTYLLARRQEKIKGDTWVEYYEPEKMKEHLQELQQKEKNLVTIINLLKAAGAKE